MAAVASSRPTSRIPGNTHTERVRWIAQHINLIYGVIHRRMRNLICVHYAVYQRGGEPLYTLEDAFSAGYLGLDRASRTWDPDKGAFSTYAEWWIWREVEADYHLFRATVVQFPEHRLKRMRALLNRKDMGTTLTEEEEKELERLTAYRDRFKDTAHQRATVYESGMDEAPAPPDAVAFKEEYGISRTLIETLPQGQQRILEYRYGEKLGLHETAQRMNMDRLAVRAAEAQALATLQKAGCSLAGETPVT